MGEMSNFVGVKPHVLREWESEFIELRPVKRRGNRRYYQRHDIQIVQQIRTLLYDQGCSIGDARVKLRELLPSIPDAPQYQIEIISIGQLLSDQILKDPSAINHISPREFELLICDRLYAMGLEPKLVGATNRRDGGVDIVFWPRTKSAFPFLGAAQVKHHRDWKAKEGPAVVREFAGVLSSQPFHAGLIVTNTSFTPDAKWFAREHASLLKLREFEDIRRWLINRFDDEEEWREIPKRIELCPGVFVDLR